MQKLNPFACAEQPAGAPPPLISVILPTYNRAHFIEQAIISVLSQTGVTFELIVIDDGSTDTTAEILQGILDPNLRIITQENQGRSAARNNGLKLARGKFIAFLDSDDRYLPGKLVRQVTYLNAHPEHEMVYTAARCVNFAGVVLDIQPYRASAEGFIYKKIAFHQPLTITLPTVMLRREVIERCGGFDEELDRFEDTDLWRRIAKIGSIGAIDEFTCDITTHDGNSISAQDPEQLACEVLQYIKKVFLDDSDLGSVLLRNGASILCSYYGRALLYLPRGRSAAVRLFGQSITFAPWRAAIIVLQGMRSIIGALYFRYRAQMKYSRSST